MFQCQQVPCLPGGIVYCGTFWHDADKFYRWFQLLHCKGDTRDQPAAPYRDDYLIQVRDLLQKLQCDGPLACDSIAVRDRMHIKHLFRFRELTGCKKRVIIGFSDFQQVGTQ